MRVRAPRIQTRTISRASEILAGGLPIGPRTDPCVCRTGRMVHGGRTHTGGNPASGCTRYRIDPAWELAYRAAEGQNSTLGKDLRNADKALRDKHYRSNPRKPGEWSIGASDTSTCPRKIQYRNAPPDDLVRASEDTREALAGTMLHEGITTRMQLLYPWREFGGKVRIPGLDRDSEFDVYDPITAELEDYKSAGRYRWDLVGDHGPDLTVWEQVMLYAYALIASGRPVRTVRVSYYHREKGHDETFVGPYDESMAKIALDRLLGYATSLDLGIDLPKTGTGPSNDELCRRCFARLHCWNIPAAESAGRSPESYTILGPAPADPEVVWAIREKVRTATERLDAEKEEKVAKGLLTGITPGRYGDFEGYESGGGGGDDHAAYAEALARFYVLPDAERPALEDITMPQKRKYQFIKWARVRQATLATEKRNAKAAAKATKDVA